jgi:hypothetical protein
MFDASLKVRKAPTGECCKEVALPLLWLVEITKFAEDAGIMECQYEGNDMAKLSG